MDGLLEIETAAWQAMANAVSDPQSPFRYLGLATVDADGQPQLRTVVLRAVDVVGRCLEFHTDIRSRKWAELTRSPRASVMAYCPVKRMQLRLTGMVRLYGPDSPQARQTWDRLPDWTRNTYRGGPPGDEPVGGETLVSPSDIPPDAAAQTESAGQAVFGVLQVSATTLDWVQLDRSANRRALFRYPTGQGCWLNP